MSIYKRGKTYYTRIYIDGREIRRSLDTDNRRVAVQKERALRDSLWEQKNLHARATVSFAEAMDLFLHNHCRSLKPKSALRYRVSAKQLYPHFKDYSLAAITRSEIHEYVTTRQEEGVSDRTISLDLACLSSMFRVAINAGYCDTNPVTSYDKRALKPSKKIVRWLDDDEYNDLINAAAEPMKSMIILSAETGVRQGELLSIKLSDISEKDDNPHLLKIPEANAKNGNTRIIPLTQEAARIISGTPKYVDPHTGRPGEYLFWHGSGERYTSINKRWYRVLEKSGVKNFRWHDLRHHAASKWRQSGMSLDRIMELLGHSSIQMVLRYGHLGSEHLVDAIKEFDNFRAQVPDQNRITEARIIPASTDITSKSVGKLGEIW